MLKLKVLGRILDSGLVAVVRSEKSDEALRITEACTDGGAAAVEITFTVPRAADTIEDISRRNFRSGLLLGAGTVLDPLSPAFVKAVKAAFPHASLMPTGGVSFENVAGWIKAG